MPFDILSQLFGRLAPSMETEDPFLTSVLRWFGGVQQHAIGRWRIVASQRIPCAVRQRVSGQAIVCHHPAVDRCTLCGSHTCLAHAALTATGVITCLACLATYEKVVREARRQAPDSEAHEGHAHAHAHAHGHRGAEDELTALRKRHLKTLGLKDPSSSEEISDAFRRLGAKHHPDRQSGAQAKAKAEKRFKEISEAYHWLQKNEPARKAA